MFETAGMFATPARDQWKRLNKPLVGWWECDPEITRTEMKLTAPVKYPGSDK